VGIDEPFTSVTIPPPECTSPVGLCTRGQLRGDLDGTYEFVADTLVPAADPSHPSRFFYTGHSTITPKRGRGQLFGEDHGFLDMNPAGKSPFVTTVLIMSGTKRWTHVTGTIVAEGDLVLATGEATGSYTGALCRACGHRHDD
jgi:hypothetical protein